MNHAWPPRKTRPASRTPKGATFDFKAIDFRQHGKVVAVMGRAIGVWWLNACRVAYVVDETGPISKFGFAC